MVFANSPYWFYPIIANALWMLMFAYYLFVMYKTWKFAKYKKYLREQEELLYGQDNEGDWAEPGVIN